MLSIMVRSLWGKGVSQNGMNFCPGDVDFQGSSPPALLACVSLQAVLILAIQGTPQLSSLSYARLPSYPRAPAPPLLLTSAHVLRKLFAIAFATFCAFGERNTARKRCL